MNYDNILAALETRVLSLTDVPDIAFENVKYIPKTDVTYLRTRFMPMDRRPASCGIGPDLKPYMQHYYGVFQIVINCPESKGQAETNKIVNEICDKFEAATDISHEDVYVTIKQVERMRGISEAPWYKTPVNIHWFSYTK